MLLFIEEDAESDLVSARDWYDLQQPGLADEFIDEFSQLTSRILEFPLMDRVVFEHVRQAALTRFPYYVFYVVEDELVCVVAVIHKHRDPKVWLSRIS